MEDHILNKDFSIDLKSRLTNRSKVLTGSIFGEISLLAKKHQAVNLGQGFPEADGPSWLKNFYIEAIEGAYNQYPPVRGINLLVNQLTQHYSFFYQRTINPENVLVTNGATEAICLSLLSIVEKDDEVILFTPCYDSYFANIKFAGGKTVELNLIECSFRPQISDVHQLVNKKTKAIVINSPHNPSGSILDSNFLLELADYCHENKIFLICDEVYEFLTFDDQKYFSLIAKISSPYIMIISSSAKTFDFTGWKVGWVIANQFLIDHLSKIHQYFCYSVNTPAQYAIAKGLEQIRTSDYLALFKKNYLNKKNLLMDGLSKTPFKIFPVSGTYFILAQLPGSENLAAYDFVTKVLIPKYQVAAIPCETFFLNPKSGERIIRFCFAKSEETILSACHQLQKIN